MQALVKWLAAIAVGAAVAAAQAVLAKLGAAPAGIDPFVVAVVVAVLTKLVNYLVAKLPVEG